MTPDQRADRTCGHDGVAEESRPGGGDMDVHNADHLTLLIIGVRGEAVVEAECKVQGGNNEKERQNAVCELQKAGELGKVAKSISVGKKDLHGNEF